MDKIKRCLLGNNVRYDGRHKLDHYLKNAFDKFVNWVPVCPEVECGLGVPREAMHLVGASESPKLVTENSDIDYTEKMLKWAKEKLEQLEKEKLCGFIFKNNSPSCGLNRVLSKNGIGIFAKEFSSYFKLMPVEDEDRLRDEGIRESFIKDIYIFKKKH
ncbi:MAG: DUF523 domain-containing protein [Candidatus Omnitrophica bacterium]|nr:DUF523 domain-containing protein [Candidatus Omnitrophota bacterium]